MRLTVRVKFVLADNARQGLAGIKASLYDRDRRSADDLLGTGTTDGRGEIFFTFDERLYKDAEDQPEWRIESLPDLYVVVHDAAGHEIYSTRYDVKENTLPALMTVPIPREIVDRHRLLEPQ